jgi:hypothetical protein
MIFPSNSSPRLTFRKSLCEKEGKLMLAEDRLVQTIPSHFAFDGGLTLKATARMSSPSLPDLGPI